MVHRLMEQALLHHNWIFIHSFVYIALKFPAVYLPYCPTAYCTLLYTTTRDTSSTVYTMAGPAPPEPKSLLGRYRPLAPTASVKVSPLCLGAMSFGKAWYVVT